jgi:hypothetical protein
LGAEDRQMRARNWQKADGEVRTGDRQKSAVDLYVIEGGRQGKA